MLTGVSRLVSKAIFTTLRGRHAIWITQRLIPAKCLDWQTLTQGWYALVTLLL